MKKLCLFLLPLALFAKPFKVEEILSDKNELKTDFTISYVNITKKTEQFSPIVYETNQGDFVTIPTYEGSSSNQDYISYTQGLKYGLTQDLEIFTNISFYTFSTHTSGDSFETKNDNGFNSLNLGFNYLVKEEDDKPSFLVGLSTDVLENTIYSDNNKNNEKFKSYSLFATSYYTIDPLVFSLEADYGLNMKKELNNHSIDSGEVFTLTPQVYFAINPFINLNWGLKYQFNQKNRVDDKVVSNSGSSVGYLFGGSYEFSTKTVFELNYENSDTNDYSMNNITATVSYKF